MSLKNIITSEITSQLAAVFLQQTALRTMLSALTWPAMLLKVSEVIDNTWSVAKDRADKAGLLLADVLASRAQGSRPVRLIGYSMGARLLFRCLESLADRAKHDDSLVDIVEDCYLLGATVRTTPARWAAVRRVVAGKLVNGYARSDWVLGFVYRHDLSALSQWHDMGIAGLAAVDVDGVTNIELTGIVEGHLAYREAMEQIIGEVDFIDDFDVTAAFDVKADGDI